MYGSCLDEDRMLRDQISDIVSVVKRPGRQLYISLCLDAKGILNGFLFIDL